MRHAMDPSEMLLALGRAHHTSNAKLVAPKTSARLRLAQSSRLGTGGSCTIRKRACLGGQLEATNRVSMLGVQRTPIPQRRSWIEKMAHPLPPESIFWCSGSSDEQAFLTQEAVDKGVLIKLNQEKWPVFTKIIALPQRVSAGIAVHIYLQQAEAGRASKPIMGATAQMSRSYHCFAAGSHSGPYHMYVVPDLMGPVSGSPLSKIGIEPLPIPSCVSEHGW